MDQGKNRERKTPMTINLKVPDLTELKPRMQSRVEVVPLRQGDAVIFPVNLRPVNGTRGPYRVNMRHGVSRLRAGLRHTLGVIFHDAT